SSWSPGSSVANEPTIEPSAPSARCVCPRITPGWSSNVRFTRSSNSRIRSIWVNIHTSRSLSSTAFSLLVIDLAPRLCDARAELRDRRLVCTLKLFLDRQGAQRLGENLDSPGALVSHLAAGLDVTGDVELALARKLAVVDDLVDRVLHVLELPIGQLDPGQILGRDALELIWRNAELGHVPGVDRKAAVWLVCLGDER